MRLRQLSETLKLKQAIQFLRVSWNMIGITLLLLLSLEITAQSVLWIRKDYASDPRVKADVYQGQTWTDQYFKEFKKSHHMKWKPYVYYRHAPFEGDYINVSREGLRSNGVQNDVGTGNDQRLQVLVFGGSTTWGAGARDAFTIPSLLEKKLNAGGIPCDVTNLGESGWSSTQEVIQLMLWLQKGQIPDLVIFYDGVNDTSSAYQSNVAGLSHNEFNRIQEFNLTKKAVRYSANDLATVHILRQLIFSSTVQDRDAIANHDQLSGEIAQVYFRNVEIAGALAKQYQFEAMFYLQPTIYDKESLTIYEQAQRDNAPPMAGIHKLTYQAIREESASFSTDIRFKDLSQIFADIPEPLFIDWCHLGENGNELVAQRIADDILPDTESAARKD